MGSRGSGIEDQSTADNTPEDVAVLYSWANLQGAKYRDYSASRREYRAQVRYRAAKALLERELEAQMRAEASAAEAERIARIAAVSADAVDFPGQSAQRVSLRSVEDAARKATTERVEAARRAESAARAAVLALREEREIAEAHTSAVRQASLYEEAELRRRELAGPQPVRPLDESDPAPGTMQRPLPGGSHPGSQQFLFSNWQEAAPISDWTHSWSEPRSSINASASPEQVAPAPDAVESDEVAPDGEDLQPNAPAWLFPAQIPARQSATLAVSAQLKPDALSLDTLQASREKVAARWFALRDVFDRAAPDLPAMQPPRPGPAMVPALAVFSLAGGVGKTSLIATLARAFAEAGEHVALADTTSVKLLPVFFSARDKQQTRPAEVPQVRSGENVRLIQAEVGDRPEAGRGQEDAAEEIVREAQGCERLALDLGSGPVWLLRSLAELRPLVLVPMAPDMNSLISLQAVERLFRGILDADGRPLLPFYVLNKFDASLALHLDVREVLRRQLGDRLLRCAIRRSPAVSEALADGMTVLDYAPEAPVSHDYREIAAWVRSVSPAAPVESRVLRRGDK